MKKLISSVACIAMVAACTPYAQNVESSYVSRSTYSSQSCSKLMNERNLLIREVNELTKVQNNSANADVAFVTLGLLVAWPILLAAAAENGNTEALSSAKGHYDAITEQMVSQGCKIPQPTVVQKVTVEPTKSSSVYCEEMKKSAENPVDIMSACGRKKS